MKRNLIKLAILGAGFSFLTLCSKKKETEAAAATTLTIKGTLGVQAQSVALAPPAGTWKVYCEQLDLSTNSCVSAVDATSGAFELTCDKLANVEFQCFLKKDTTVIAPIKIDDRWLVRASSGTVDVTIAFDTDSSYAKATVADTTTSASADALVSPSDANLEGTYTLACDTNSDGFSSSCAADEWYFHKASESDPSRFGIWDTKTAADACASEYAPQFKLQFNGDATKVHRMAFDSNSIGEPMVDAADAFFSAAPTALTTATVAVTTALQTNIEYAGFSLVDLNTNAMVDLLSLNTVALNAITATCTAYDALTAASKAKVDIGIATLCTMGATDRAAAVTWLKNTRQKSCVPKVTIDRVFDATKLSWYAMPTCIGSQSTSACFDKTGLYVGGIIGRKALMRLRSRTAGTVEWSQVDTSSFKIADSANTASACQNNVASLLTVSNTATGVWSGLWTQTEAHGCANAGYTRPIGALSTSVPTFSASSYRVKLTKQ